MWKYFCYCCSLTSDEIVKPNSVEDTCSICKKMQETESDWICFCQPFSSKDQTAKCQAALDELVNQWNHDMERVKREGKFKIGVKSDKLSINYTPQTMDETTEFMLLLIKEMRLCGCSTLQKDLAQLQRELKEYLEAEASMELLIGQITEGRNCEESMERIMIFVPCIMHCENRVGIKILTMLLIEGLSNYQ